MSRHSLLEMTRIQQEGTKMHCIESYSIEQGLRPFGRKHKSHAGIVVVSKIDQVVNPFEELRQYVQEYLV